jgi:polysaccharide biosynthesis/export protein
MNGRNALAVGVVVFLMFLAGCGAKQVAQPVSTANSQPPTVVRLAAGDVVEVKFFNVSELNESQTIRPDGRISLQLIGEVEVQGRTPAELRDELNRLYAPHLKASDVTVIVRSFQSRRVYVGGEVIAPGVINMPGPLTAMQAIMEAGGFTRFARMENVVIIRHADGKRYGASLDFKPSQQTAPAPEPFYLEPLDIVFVPETKITRVNRWIDQHINQILPTFGVVYTWKPTADATVEIDTTRFRNVK